MLSSAYRLAGLATLVILGLAMVQLGGIDPAAPGAQRDIDPALVSAVGQIVANDAARLFGDDSPQYCLVTDAVALCIHPDTPPERVEEILRSLPTWSGEKYGLGNRWSSTAIDGPVAANSPINLTYSFLDDGVWIPGSNEAGSSSRLYQEMNGHFGNEATWKALFADMFDDWGRHIGVTYQEVSDDGAAFPASSGELGLRGDVRIGAHSIDGTYGVLAYNYFPQLGDMVLDTAENWSASYNGYVYMRNICRHEHGHGLGLQHVDPTSCQKLMEPYVCTSFDGPQDDDYRGAMRHYGDTYESNNTAAAATDLGTLDGTFSPAVPVSLTTSVDFDYFRFTTTGAAYLDVTVDPVGARYEVDGSIVQTDEVMDLTFRVLGGANGTDVLIQVDDTGVGEDETLVDFVLPAAGDYWVLVYRAAGTPDVQRYDLTIDVEPSDVTGAGDTPLADLGLALYPNPFNPRTTARFYVEAPGSIELDIYDVAGKRVRSIQDRAVSAGWRELSWDGRDGAGLSMPSGTYLMQVRAGGRVQVARGVLVE